MSYHFQLLQLIQGVLKDLQRQHDECEVEDGVGETVRFTVDCDMSGNFGYSTEYNESYVELEEFSNLDELVEVLQKYYTIPIRIEY